MQIVLGDNLYEMSKQVFWKKRKKKKEKYSKILAAENFTQHGKHWIVLFIVVTNNHALSEFICQIGKHTSRKHAYIILTPLNLTFI